MSNPYGDASHARINGHLILVLTILISNALNVLYHSPQKSKYHLIELLLTEFYLNISLFPFEISLMQNVCQTRVFLVEINPYQC